MQSGEGADLFFLGGEGGINSAHMPRLIQLSCIVQWGLIGMVQWTMLVLKTENKDGAVEVQLNVLSAVFNGAAVHSRHSAT